MISLQNDQLVVKVNEYGAELSSVIDRKSGFEFIWQADKKYGARHSPVLFPIIGQLKDDQYEYKGQTYEMSRHGFARDLVFQVEESNANAAVFSLTYSEETLKNYPFKFKLLVKYLLHGANLTVTYEVINLSTSEVMYYSVGGHPAFNVSLSENLHGEKEFDNLFLEILPDRMYNQYPVSDKGLIQLHKSKRVEGDRRQITHEMFKEDALVYEILNQSEVVLLDQAENVEIRIKPNRMNYLAIWSPSPSIAPFVCVEPWAGFSDSERSNGKLIEKDGISLLNANEKMTHEYTINFLKEMRIQSIKRWENKP